MEAALKPGTGSPPDLNLAFLCERWGAQAVLGPTPNALVLMQFSYLMQVYRVFAKTKDAKAHKAMTAEERNLMRDVMILKVDLDRG